MLSANETVVGLRLILSAATLRVQELADALQVGAVEVPKRAESALTACNIAQVAIGEARPTLRRLGRPVKDGAH